METPRELFPEERRLQILSQAGRDGRVAVTELSQQFGVSEVTIRADLQELAERGLLLRTHGGAVTANRKPELSFTLRSQQQTAQKERIGAAGAELVADGDAIFLDTSSTSLAVARHLRQRRDLTVLTNSLPVAESLLDAPGITVVMPGGVLQRETISLVGVDGLAMLRRLNIRLGFFGAHGVSHPEGLTDVSAAEAEVKREIVGMCRQVIAVLDATKWGRVGLASFARLEEIHTIISDYEGNNALAQQAAAFGIKLIIV